MIGAWQAFRRAGESAAVATRAALGIEELARHLPAQLAGPGRTDSEQLAGIREEVQAVLAEQRRLQEIVQVEGGPPAATLDELATAVGSLEALVSEMAISLANLIQILEQRR